MMLRGSSPGWWRGPPSGAPRSRLGLCAAALAGCMLAAFPALAATTPVGALTARANAMRLTLLDPTASGNDQVATRRSLSRIVARSAEYVVVRDGEGFVGWFDPFADGWIVSRWDMATGAWRLTGLASALPEQLRASPATDANLAGDIGWARRGGDVREALRSNDRSRVAAFAAAARSGVIARLMADGDGQAAAGGVLSARDTFILEGLTVVRHAPGYGAYRSLLRQVFLTASDKLVADQALRKRIDTLPKAVRMTLHPVMAFSRKDGFTVAVQSPFAPGLIFFADLSSRGRSDGAAVPVRLRAVSLMAGDHT
jgi:hypothetical protein